MRGKYHVEGTVCDDGIGVGRCLVKKVFYLFHGVFGGTCLLCCDRPKGWEHCGVNCPGVVQECACDLLYELFIRR